MSLPSGWLRAASFAGLIAAGSILCAAQTATASQSTQSTPAQAASPAAVQASPDSPATAKPTIDVPRPDEAAAVASAPAEPLAPTKTIYTVPAGTKVLLELRSAINTKSAKPGDGVYLSSTFPVVVGDRVMIPNGVYVQGVVDRVQRGGRVKGKAELDMHFTSIIFPNGSVVEIPGVVDSVPGSKDQTVKNDGEGTIEQNGDKGRNAGRTAEIALPSGAGVGTIGGAASGHPIRGGLIGLGAGLATVGIVSLFTRNADVDIPKGTQVEMMLQRPLMLEQENLAGVAQPGAAPALVPSSSQPKPISTRRPRILCPPGGLGCE